LIASGHFTRHAGTFRPDLGQILLVPRFNGHATWPGRLTTDGHLWPGARDVAEAAFGPLADCLRTNAAAEG